MVSAFIIIAIGIGGYIAYERFTLHQTVDKFLEKKRSNRRSENTRNAL